MAKRLDNGVESKMVAKVKENEIFNDGARQVTDDLVGMDLLLDALADPCLGERIVEAVRMATDEHILHVTQEVRSEVESESSAK
ncbi:MAG: hypothetical protein GY869_03955 [Planctomycetes bacterium]|nr:hypothetical protein [Planctomycetota bacterium]